MKDSEPIGLLIADEHEICREALRNLFEQEDEFLVLGEAADGIETLEKVIQVKPRVVLLDMIIAHTLATDVLRRMKELSLDVAMLVMADVISDRDALQLLQSGANGIVLKECSPCALFKSIRAAAEGEIWIGRKLVAGLVKALRDGATAQSGRPSTPYSLTRRELEIVAEVAEGCTNRNIAEKFSIAEQTVKHHLTSIFQKLGVSNRLELAVFAMHHGIRNNAAASAAQNH
jgi:two-component system, NarL family, nitrate/nitrite response regulator NarL